MCCPPTFSAFIGWGHFSKQFEELAGLNINGRIISDLQYGDKVLPTDSDQELHGLMEHLNRCSIECGLDINRNLGYDN